MSMTLFWWLAVPVLLFIVFRVVLSRVRGADVEVNVNVSVGEEHARYARDPRGRGTRVKVDPGKDDSKDSSRRIRRGWPIHAYVGPNGGGKSLCMVYDTIPSLKAGRTVLSTVRILDFENPRRCEGSALDDPDLWPLLDAEGKRKHCDDPANHRDAKGERHWAAHPCYVPLRDFSQIIEARSCDILMDEVTGVASSRESHAMPMQVANKLVQLRRADVVLRWSSPNWARSDKIIREVTQSVTNCRGMLPVAAPASEAGDRLWRDKRLFAWKTYDAAGFDEFTEGKREKVSAGVSQWFWRPGKLVEKVYDTRDAVTALGWASESGYCMSCGGHRSRPRCRCVRDEGAETATPATGTAAARRAAAGTAGGAEPRARGASTATSTRQEQKTTDETPTSLGTVAPGRHARNESEATEAEALHSVEACVC